jgi:uncharacterized membrane protein YkoI
MRFVLSAAVAAVVTLLLTVCALSQEKQINRSDLPPAVKASAARQIEGATVLGFSQEKENGKTYYEAELMVQGHSKDVLMDAQGNVVEVEEQVAIESLPAAVREGLRTKAGKGKLMKVESITKQGKLVAYEAKVLTGKKRSEIEVGPDGKPLDHEE